MQENEAKVTEFFSANQGNDGVLKECRNGKIKVSFLCDEMGEPNIDLGDMKGYKKLVLMRSFQNVTFDRMSKALDKMKIIFQSRVAAGMRSSMVQRILDFITSKRGPRRIFNTQEAITKKENKDYQEQKQNQDKETNENQKSELIETEKSNTYQNESNGFEPLQFVNPNLNQVQKLAVLRGVNCKDFLLIHGPPGTGKTVTLVELCQQLIMKQKRILFCGPSNSSVDNFLIKILDLVQQQNEAPRLPSNTKSQPIGLFPMFCGKDIFN